MRTKLENSLYPSTAFPFDNLIMVFFPSLPSFLCSFIPFFLPSSFPLFLLSVSVFLFLSSCVHMPIEIKEKLVGVGSVFPQCISHGSNSNHQIWWQGFLPTEDLCWPSSLKLLKLFVCSHILLPIVLMITK